MRNKKQTPEQKFEQLMQSAIATYYSKLHSDHIKRGLQAKKLKNVSALKD